MEAVAAEGLDQLIVADLVNPGDSGREAQSDVFWTCGFSGTSGLCRRGAGGAPLRHRLPLRRAGRARGGRRVRAGPGRAPAPGRAGRAGSAAGSDSTTPRTSVRSLRRLEQEAPEGVELVPAGGLVARLRRNKDADELRRIAEAARLADEVYEWTIERGLVGRTEQEVRLAAEAADARAGRAGPVLPGHRGRGRERRAPAPRGVRPRRSPPASW